MLDLKIAANGIVKRILIILMAGGYFDGVFGKIVVTTLFILKEGHGHLTELGGALVLK